MTWDGFVNSASVPVTIYISTHPQNRLYLKAIHKLLKFQNDWI